MELPGPTLFAACERSGEKELKKIIARQSRILKKKIMILVLSAICSLANSILTTSIIISKALQSKNNII
jgi:hypothetical protein